jgi:hydroxyacyl-ACP dehydratase HTD2-like protein with hotdog domain
MSVETLSLQVGDVVGEVTRTPDPVDLFQFSAALWLTHRIHYDQQYTTEVENHPAMPVHGPLQAVYMAQAVTRHVAGRRPGCRSQIVCFQYRHNAPAYVGAALTCGGTVTAVDGARVTFEVWAESAGRRTTVGELELLLR